MKYNNHFKEVATVEKDSSSGKVKILQKVPKQGNESTSKHENKWYAKTSSSLEVLAGGLMQYLIPEAAKYRFVTGAGELNVISKEIVGETLHNYLNHSKIIDAENLKRFQAKIFESCKAKLDRLIGYKKDYRWIFPDSTKISSLLDNNKDLKDPLDEKEKARIVQFLEEECKKIKQISFDNDNFSKDLNKSNLLDLCDLTYNSEIIKMFYENLGNEVLKDYLKAQVYNVILGNNDAHGNNFKIFEENGKKFVVPFDFDYALKGHSKSAKGFKGSKTHYEIENIKMALGDEEFKKCVEEIMKDFESKRPGFDEKMSELCTKLEIINVDALTNQIDKNIKVIKEFAGIGQVSWVDEISQNNSSILQCGIF